MNIKELFPCPIHNLKLIQPTINEDEFITTSPMPTNKTSIRGRIYFTHQKNRSKISPFFTYKGFISPNNRNNNEYNIVFAKTNMNKNKKITNIFPKISLSLDRNKRNEIHKSKNNEYLYSSMYKLMNKHPIKTENLYFMKEKQSQIGNNHRNLMKQNELYILTKQSETVNNDINNTIDNKNNIYKNLTLSEENKACFDNEYKGICKNKLKEKKLIEKEINIIGRGLSWVKREIKNEEKDMGESGCEKEDEEKKKINRFKNSLFFKKMKNKDPIYEINQASNFPIIAYDKKLLFDLWRKDMIKFCEYTLDNTKKKDKKLIKYLLNVYN